MILTKNGKKSFRRKESPTPLTYVRQRCRVILRKLQQHFRTATLCDVVDVSRAAYTSFVDVSRLLKNILDVSRLLRGL